MDDFGIISDPPWVQWCVPSQFNFAESSSVVGTGLYSHFEPQFEDLISESPFIPFLNTSSVVVRPECSIASPGYAFGALPATESPHAEHSRDKPNIHHDLPTSRPNTQKHHGDSSDRAPEKLARCRVYGKQASNAAQETVFDIPSTHNSVDKATPASLGILDHGTNGAARIRTRSRAASKKHRMTKKEEVERLKLIEADMERINHELTNCVADLTLEVYNLKLRLLQHTDCNCFLIRDYSTLR